MVGHGPEIRLVVCTAPGIDGEPRQAGPPEAEMVAQARGNNQEDCGGG